MQDRVVLLKTEGQTIVDIERLEKGAIFELFVVVYPKELWF